jgi:uncharacterized protein YfaP (DUF2135 family)
VYVSWGNGNGTFGAPITLTVGTSSARACSLTAGHFNQDGITDLAVATSGDNKVTVLLGGKTSKFKAQAYSIGGAGQVAFVGAAYLDGDGELDLMVARGSSIEVLSGSSDGEFASVGTFATGETVRYVAAGHFDRDSLWRVDLLASSDAGRLVMLAGAASSAP